MNLLGSNPKSLVKSVLLHNNPLYVQFYITARCNLACEQCNVIYANADQEEVDLEKIKRIAKNLSKIGTSIVLLTGGEPFIRKDLPEIVKIFIDAGIHPRLQTNGLASDESLRQVVTYGANDISISLDTLEPPLQDKINGGFRDSWARAIDRISFINSNFPSSSFCALGTVFAPSNFRQIPKVIKFATEIGWWTSIVPAHQTSSKHPRSFSTFDPSLVFSPYQYEEVEKILDEIRILKKQGFKIYDSEEYLSDILRFIRKEPIKWRRRNDNKCDAPNLYFAIQPNGDMAVCCDYRLNKPMKVYDDEFVEYYLRGEAAKSSEETVTSCQGCMYGSFPEITISSRFLKPMIHRGILFSKKSKRNIIPMSFEAMQKLAENIKNDR